MKIALEPDNYYHIYNHANGKENLFVNDGNYNFFLKRYANFINPIADTFAYCLMPNHFHLAIRIKSEEEIKQLSVSSKLSVSAYISKQFSNLFSSYTQAFNKQQDRMGSLFIPRFSRKQIDTEDYFRQLIIYIHLNPVHHGFVENFRAWEYSSFETFFSEKITNIKREEVLEWFGNKGNFLACHQHTADNKMSLELEK